MARLGRLLRSLIREVASQLFMFGTLGSYRLVGFFIFMIIQHRYRNAIFMRSTIHAVVEELRNVLQQACMPGSNTLVLFTT